MGICELQTLRLVGFAAVFDEFGIMPRYLRIVALPVHTPESLLCGEKRLCRTFASEGGDRAGGVALSRGACEAGVLVDAGLVTFDDNVVEALLMLRWLRCKRRLVGSRWRA